MPVLPLDCHLPTQNTTHAIKFQKWTNNKRNKGYKQLICIYISHVNVTQTVPDISPLMPMHQDPLLVLCFDHQRGSTHGVHCHYGDITWASWRLNSPETGLLIQQLVHAINKENTGLYEWVFFRAIYRWPVVSPHKLQNAEDVSIYWNDDE